MLVALHQVDTDGLVRENELLIEYVIHEFDDLLYVFSSVFFSVFGAKDCGRSVVKNLRSHKKDRR